MNLRWKIPRIAALLSGWLLLVLLTVTRASDSTTCIAIGCRWTGTACDCRPDPTPEPTHAPWLALRALSVEELAAQLEAGSLPEFDLSPIVMGTITMTDSRPPAPVAWQYAGYTRRGRIYMAERQISGQIEFRQLCPGDPVPSFGKTSSEGSNWESDVFGTLGELWPEVAGELMFVCGLYREDSTELRLAAFRVKGGRMDNLPQPPALIELLTEILRHAAGKK